MHAEGNRIKPVPVIKERIARLEERSPESFTLVLWRVAEDFLTELYRSLDFAGAKPVGLNRHWILHGRDVAEWDQADSLRMFQALDTISDLAKD